MTNDKADTPGRTGVWFVYDGACPVCTMAATALRIRQEHGPLHLVDARKNADDPLIQEIRRRNLDLDDGMVIWTDGHFYHGDDALMFMARFGEDTGWFNKINRTFFRSRDVARLCYPWMRAVRNLLLKTRGVGKLDNLGINDEPVFKPVFGPAWDLLPKVMKRHYANRAFRDEAATVEGVLRVELSPLARALKPFFLITGILVPYEGVNIPTTVNFLTDRHSNAFRFERVFHFPGKAPYAFRSRMIPNGGDEIIEVMNFGLGWRSSYSWNGQKVVLQHRGYVIHLFGVFIPAPITFLIGAGYAEEVPVGDDTFTMMMELRHPWWGRILGYDGTFTMTKDP